MNSISLKNSLFAFTLASMVLAGIAFTFNQTAAQRKDEEVQNPAKAQDQNPLRALAVIDSRLVDVPRPCTADEVTIIPDSVVGEGGTCLDAKADCRAKLARKVAEKANAECKLYSKVDSIDGEEVKCKAFRGNFNPTTNIQYDPENCKKREGQEFFDVRCTNQTPIKYTCN